MSKYWDNISNIMDYSDKQPILERQAVTELLREHGVTPTQQRVEIGCLLFGRHQHVSADQLLVKLSDEGHSVSKATVYNSLSLFARKGLLREVVVDPNKMFFDTNLNPHHHLYHLKTGWLEDIDLIDIDISRLPSLPENLDMDGIDIIIRVKSDFQ